MAHCTALPGALTPHRSSAVAPSTTVKFSGRAQKPRGAEAGSGKCARPGDTGLSAGEGRGSVWRTRVGNEGHMVLGHKTRIPLTCGQQPQKEQGNPARGPQGHPGSSACGSCGVHCLPAASVSVFLWVLLCLLLCFLSLFVHLSPSLSLVSSLPRSQSISLSLPLSLSPSLSLFFLLFSLFSPATHSPALLSPLSPSGRTAAQSPAGLRSPGE